MMLLSWKKAFQDTEEKNLEKAGRIRVKALRLNAASVI